MTGISIKQTDDTTGIFTNFKLFTDYHETQKKVKLSTLCYSLPYIFFCICEAYS